MMSRILNSEVKSVQVSPQKLHFRHKTVAPELDAMLRY